MNWDQAMEQIAARLDTMAGMRRFEEGQLVAPPAAVVSFPEEIDPHGTYNRGMARMKIQAMLLLGPPYARQTRQAAALYVNDGPTGVVTVLESGVDAGVYPAFDEITVTLISFDVVSIKEIPYMAVFVDLDVAGKGVSP